MFVLPNKEGAVCTRKKKWKRLSLTTRRGKPLSVKSMTHLKIGTATQRKSCNDYSNFRNLGRIRYSDCGYRPTSNSIERRGKIMEATLSTWSGIEAEEYGDDWIQVAFKFEHGIRVYWVSGSIKGESFNEHYYSDSDDNKRLAYDYYWQKMETFY